MTRALRSAAWWALFGALLVAGAGCGATTKVTGRVLQPARVPVRTFPRIWVASGHRPSERAIADAIVRHLARDGTVSVRRVDVEQLEPARKAGRIPRATAVLLLDLSLQERVESQWTTRPETVCGAYGCYTQQRSYLYDVPILTGQLTMTVYEGPTARILQQKTIEQTAEGRGREALRREVVEALIEKARRMVDQQVEKVEVVLLEVDLPGVDRALEHLREGRWHQGREGLERVARSERGRALGPEKRARLLYDLGQARRFDPTTMDDPEAHFAAAAEALRGAQELDPQKRYEAALADLETHREQVTLVLEQRAAARRNFQKAREPEQGIPPPPPSYER